MRFEVLGAVQAVVDGQGVRPVSELRRRLLAVLLVRANRSVAVDTLVEALWGPDAPQRPGSNLQLHVHRLRQVLDRPERLRGVSGGYLLDVAPDELDALVFADRHSTGRAAAESGELDRAATTFREALELWRGTPYADVDEAQVVGPEARRLAEARLVACEELYDAELGRGRAREIVPELTDLVAGYPLRERLTGQLMLALYRSGRQSKAEATYRAAHRRLARDLKTQPGRELRELYASIRSEDPSLDDPKPARVAVATPVSAPRPAQLPPAPGAFFGRAAERDELDQAGDAGGLVVIAGMAGVGKTGLAVHYAQQVVDRYGDGQLYLDLRGHSSVPALEPLEALGHLLRGLGADPSRVPGSVEEATAEYRSLIAGRKILVLLDNARSAEQVRPLLPATPGCLTLVTSRHRLSGLVAREGAERISLGTLDPEAARAVLSRLIGRERATAEAEHVAALAQVCAGLPLALRIAGAQLADEPRRSVADYVSELHDQGLTVLALDDDEESAVAAAFDLSYQHLEPGVRRLFRFAGLIPGIDFTVDALASLGGTTITDARTAVRALSNAHLLEQHAPGRFRFHDLVRDYAKQRAHADSDADRADALNRLCTWYYLGKEEAAGFLISWRLQAPLPPLPDVPQVSLSSEREAVAWLKAEFDNIAAAIRMCADNGPAHWCWHLAVGVIADMERRGHIREVLSIFEIVVATARAAADQQAIALALGETGGLWSSLGRPMPGELIGEMLTAAENSGDAVVAGYARYIAGVVHLRSDDAAAAIEYLSQARDLQERAGDATGLTLTLLHLGNAAFAQGDLHGSLRAYERMVETSGERTPSLTLAGLLNVCHARITIGQVEGIDSLFAHGERLIEQVQDGARRCVLEYMRASWYRDSGRVDEAISLLTAAARRAEELDLLRVQIHICNELGISYLVLGDHAAARDELEQSLAMTASGLLREYRAHALRGLALLALAESSFATAESLAREAIRVAAGADRLQEGDAFTVLARAQLALGDTAASIESGTQALTIHQETSSCLGTARAHHVLGEAQSDKHHLTEALTRFESVGSPEATDVRRLLAAPTA